ncbi:MAG: protein kinase [Myxococcaceae bacterium]
MSACPSENELLELSEGRASEAVRAHLLGCAECQDVLGALSGGPRLAPGDTVGRYQLRGTLGAGAMGVVYDAWDPELARPVALKLVRAGIDSSASTAELHERLKREAQAMARLADPHVVAVFDVGRLDEQVFVAMEQVRGGTLASWLKEKPRTLDEVLARLMEAGRGLAAAHRAGLVHRDFKPENILIGEDGRARVTDFGLARVGHAAARVESDSESAGRAGIAVHGGHAAGRVESDSESAGRTGITVHGAHAGARVESDSESAGRAGAAVVASDSASVTRTGVAVGTPIYMAPEQLAGRPFDARADLFAFAVTCFEALTGARPWAASTLDGLVEARAAGADLAKLRTLPRALRRAIEQGLALDPAARWASMDAFLSALDPAPRRRRRAVVMVALAAVALLSLVAWASGPRVDCAATASAWGGTWDAATRERLSTAFVATGVPWARNAFEVFARRLDERAHDWQQERQAACVAAVVEKTETPELYARRLACLDDRLRQTRGLVEFLSRPDAEVLERTTALVDALEPIAECRHPRDVAALTAEQRAVVSAAMGQVEQARLLRTVGRYQPGFEEAARAVTALEATPAKVELGEALVVLALLHDELMRYEAAAKTYQAAIEVGLEARAPLVMADAFFGLSGVYGYRWEKVDEARRFLSWGRAALGDEPDVRRHARYFERLSLIEWSLEANPDQAQRDYAKSLALTAGLTERDAARFEHQHGPAEFDMGHFDLALGIFEASEAQLLRDYGPAHPELLEASENKAEVLAILGRPDEAAVILRDLLARFPERAAGYTNHRLAEALRRGGHFAEALVEDERALEAMKGTPAESSSWAQPLVGRGLDLVGLGRAADALESLERAVRLRETLALTAPRGEAHFALARALWDSKRDRARALTLAQTAEQEFRDADARWHSKWFAQWADEVAAWRKERAP